MSKLKNVNGNLLKPPVAIIGIAVSYAVIWTIFYIFGQNDPNAPFKKQIYSANFPIYLYTNNSEEHIKVPAEIIQVNGFFGESIVTTASSHTYVKEIKVNGKTVSFNKGCNSLLFRICTNCEIYTSTKRTCVDMTGTSWNLRMPYSQLPVWTIYFSYLWLVFLVTTIGLFAVVKAHKLIRQTMRKSGIT